MSIDWRAFLLASLLVTGAGPARTEDSATVALTIKDHRFEPAELKVPAGKPFVIAVKNLDPTAEEFESRALKIEKVIAGRSDGTVRVHALAPGRYEFIGEYHSDTAKGALIAE